MSIKFAVSYTLSEYLSFVRDHAPGVIAQSLAEKGKDPSKKPSRLLMSLVVGGACIAFFFKKRAMPLCEFDIDEERIERTAAGRKSVVPWSEITAVHRYSQGYLVVKGEEGAMPLPYRCLSTEQAADLAAIIGRRA